ncbi:hypothetical protein GPECTOR_11g319 [Gonium pectorale]|uniref:SGNH hydrolase-type esterase domain-containing protein n=1 Tax=Gonium pectorale TaxID=33097 RepID=A0A150GQ06_GONPE|nr:hypothetical protein GPECTOR_11g319 [Gonium pectorale]|eukprot:KXZ51884.1 hypothetical protein GPECTOR_11g319 [Gonium pectorale]
MFADCLAIMRRQPCLPRLGLALLIGLFATRIHSLSESWMGQNWVQRTKARPELEWDWGHTWSTVEVDRQPVSQLLQGVLGSYRFTLPRSQLQRGTAYVGASSRLRRLMRDMILPREQKDFKVAVIGGSISFGQYTSKLGETDWFSILSKWLIAAFPRANVTIRNGCTPGIPTPYMIMCLELSVDPDVDLVFMEYTLNDGMDGGLFGNRVVMDTERLLRRILALPHQPAVVMMHVPLHGMASYPSGHPKNPNNDIYLNFYQTTEDAQGALAQYYDVQYLSLRTALYRLAAHKDIPGFRWEDLFVDHHPGDAGHKVMADLAIHLLQRTALGLLMEPFGQQDAEAAAEPLPPPMYPGNFPPTSPMCLVGEPFKSLVVMAEGFEYINEGTPTKPKFGYVALRPGSRLQLRLDTDRSAVGAKPDESVNVYLHHLRSYAHMGTATVSCMSGCSCPMIEINAHISERVSQVYMSMLVASQSRECVLEVQVLDKTSSGENKFKVTGIVVSERAGRSDVMERLGGDNAAFGLRQHNGDTTQMVWTKDGIKGGEDTTKRRRRGG